MKVKNKVGIKTNGNVEAYSDNLPKGVGLSVEGMIQTGEIPVKVVNKSINDLPQYETSGAAGMDVRAELRDGPVVIYSGATKLIKTGLFVEIPQGYEIQVRPRSGLAFKHGITVLNSPGTIDSDYRGEIGVILINHGTEDFVVNHGDRIGQLVLAHHERIQWMTNSHLSSTERGEGGFGHTGK